MDPMTIMAIINAASGMTEGGTSAVAQNKYGKGNFVKGATAGIPIIGPLLDMAYQNSMKDEKEQDELERQAEINDQYDRLRLNMGGRVVGPGTTKSDSVKTKLPIGSFVVPSENADIAMGLGKALFGWKDNQTMNGTSGTGRKVALSNKEVVFSPTEVNAMETAGIDIAKLAPKSEFTKEAKCGGRLKRLEGGFIEMAKGGYVKLADVGDVPNSLGGKKSDLIELTSDDRFYYDKKTKRLVAKDFSYSIDRDGTVYTRDKKTKVWSKASADDTEKNFPSQDRIRLAKNMGKLFTEGESISNAQEKAANDDRTDLEKAVTQSDLDKIADEEEARKMSQPYAGPENASQLSAADRKAETDKNKSKSVADYYKNMTAEELAEVNKALADDSDVNLKDAIITAQQYKNLGGTNQDMEDDLTDPEKKGDGSGSDDKSKMDLATALGLGQAATGLISSIAHRKDEPKPYELNKELQMAYSRAKQEAEYGMTPGERTELERSITNQQKAADFNARQASAGSGGSLLSFQLGNAINANNAFLKVKQYDDQLKLQKQQFAANYIPSLMSDSQFKYAENRRLFEREEDAYAGMINAGIHNIMGAQRFRNQLLFEKELKATGNPNVYATLAGGQ